MPARVRTKRRSALPALRLSTLRPSTYNIRPTEVATVVCPDCLTWQRIMGGTTRTIRDHHASDLSGAELEAGERDRRCPSARRVVEIDLTAEEIAKWQRVQDRRISPDALQAEIRRPTKVLRKVPTPKPPALHQLTPAGPTADSAKARYEAHRSRCTTCATGLTHCQDGLRLEGDFRVALYREPQRLAAQDLAEEDQRLADLYDAEQQPKRRQAEWDDVLPATQHTDMVRRTGLLDGYAEPRHLVYGAQAPTDTLHPAA